MATVKRNKSAEKRARQSEKRRRRNRVQKTAIKVIVKTARTVSTPEAATAELKKATKVLSRLVTKGALHKNTAARRISKMAKRAQKLAK